MCSSNLITGCSALANNIDWKGSIIEKIEATAAGSWAAGRSHTHAERYCPWDTLCYVLKGILAGAYVTTAKKAEKVIEVNRKSNINHQVEED